ncbi:GNAT family N-acetyltransferase [Dactylosporangium sp. NBC_01737]|uniref:GNAT family N-acetyltransferase n=1 Tax=Dactylosporangium sp. NBC_01737 TaxID=2975959 RepID=UPI002E156BB1|nr:GNAT family N-acetyltransferase [Dactylosporangium sp. NBC_01737]
MAVVVRRAQARDGAGRARLWQEAGAFFAALDPHTAQEPSPQGLADWHDELYERFAADPSVLMLVAELDGEIVGTAVARLHEPLPSSGWQVQRDLGRRRVHVDALAVAGAARRSGIGTALMAEVERWAVELDAAAITLETGLDNPTSMPFYEARMGYTRHEVVFRKQLP